MLKPKKTFARSVKMSDHWCVHCSCHIRGHSVAEYSKELTRYIIVCSCGKCPGYARRIDK